MKQEEIRYFSRPMRLSVHLTAWIYLLWAAGDAFFSAQLPGVMFNRLGLGALTLLTLCLACTPVNIVFNFPPVRRVRRLLGLYAFFYACLHLLVLIGWVYRWDWNYFIDQLRQIAAQQIGLATFGILLVLALTSISRARRALRRNWKRLHRLTYVAGVLGALHMSGAPDASGGLGALYLGIILLLLAVRLPPV